MAGYMYLGNKKVCPVILMNGKSVYNVDGEDWLGKINQQGTLVPATKDIELVFSGVEDVSVSQLEGKFSGDSRVISVSFPNLITLSGSYACSNMCNGYSSNQNISRLTSVYFPVLESITGSYALNNAFRGFKATSISFPALKTVSADYGLSGCLYQSPNLESCYFPELESVSGLRAMGQLFPACQNLITASFPKLKTIGDSSCYQMFYNVPSIEHISFPVLENAGDNAFDTGISSCASLKTISFPSLKTAGIRCFNNCRSNPNLISIDFSSLESCGEYCFLIGFDNSPSLTTASFPKLSSMGQYAMRGAFQSNISLESLWFNALTSESFGGYTNQFNDMLYGCNGVTVHFPADIEDTIDGWADVIDGFGGTNTTILYDINPCYVVLNVVGTSDYTIYVNGKEKVSPFTTGASNKEYCVYDNTNDRVFFGMLTGLVTDETTTITADVTTATNRVNISTGNASYPVHISYNGYEIPLANDGSGNYHFFYNGSGNTFSCVVEETANTRRLESSFTTTGSSMSVSLVPQSKEWTTFNRPNLTADGTMGGTDFAVTSSGTYNSTASRQAWCAVDGNTTTTYYWYSNNTANPTYTFYNPTGLKVSSLAFRWTTTTYGATSFVLAGSNDGSTWTNIGTYNLASSTTPSATIDSTTSYKYHRMTFTKSGTYIRLVELTISATEYK